MGIRPIAVNYLPVGDDWAIAVTTGDKTLTSKAPGLIAARDRAEQLVDKIAPQEEGRTVVHLLQGDAVAFTTAYLNARHGIPAPAIQGKSG
jgi:glycine/serine hydroxymethyltransferase